MTERDPAKLEDEHHQRLGNMSEQDMLVEARKALFQDLAAKARAGTLTKDDKRLLRDILNDTGLNKISTPGDETLPKGPNGEGGSADLPDLPDGETF